MLPPPLFAARKFVWPVLLVILLGFAGIFGLDVWYGSRLAALPDHDYTMEIMALRKEGRVGEALALCRYVESQPEMPNRDAIVGIGLGIEHDQAGWLGKSKRFFQGFLMGKVNSPEEMIGTAISDFLIVGDLRDLGQQGYNAATGHEVDKAVVILSSLGTAISVASWLPEPGEPAIATADAGISLLKALRKINALSQRFAAQTIELARDALKAKKLGRFGELVERLGLVAKHAPAGTIGTAMKDVESLDDLKAIARSLEAAPNETITALSLKNQGAVEWLESTGYATSGVLGKVLRKGAAGISVARPYIRGTKFLHRGRLNEIRNGLIDWVQSSPTARKMLFWLSLCAMGLSALLTYSLTLRIRAFIGNST